MDDAHEILESIRRRVEHEDNLVNQRLSWILTSQAFLLTGYAILLNAPLDLRAKNYARQHELLMKLIPSTGIATVLLIWLAIFGALIAMRDLRAYAVAHPGYDASHVQGRRLTRLLGMAAPLLIPLVFLVTWLVIILS